jgi:hypothetical protein
VPWWQPPLLPSVGRAKAVEGTKVSLCLIMPSSILTGIVHWGGLSWREGFQFGWLVLEGELPCLGGLFQREGFHIWVAHPGERALVLFIFKHFVTMMVHKSVACSRQYAGHAYISLCH